MVNKCSARKCRSGYDGKTPPGVSLHSFPKKDPELRKKWIDALGKAPGWKPSASSAICSLHFLPTDFSLLSKDLNAYRRRKKKGDPLKRRRLLPNVVPSVFQVLGKSDVKLYTCLQDIRDEFEDQGPFSLPSDVYLMPKGTESLHLLGLTFDSTSGGPKMNYSLNVFKDLTYSMTVGETTIMENVSRSPKNRITSFMALNDALHILKTQAMDPKPQKGVQELENTLVQIKKGVISLPDYDKRRNRLLFLLEQLDTVLHYKENYSKSLITLGVLWNKVAPRFYRSLSTSDSDRLLTLPSPSILRSHSDIPFQKLKDRFSHCATEADRLVSIMISETASSKYSGAFKGGKYMSHGHRGSLLDLTVKKIFCRKDSKEEDISTFIPLTYLDYVIVRNHVFEMIEACTKVGFKVVSLVLDVGPHFHDFYTKELFEEEREQESLGKPRTASFEEYERFIENPYDDTPGNKIYVIFNPRHCLKSLLDHWIEMRRFDDVPPFKGDESVGVAEITKIEELLLLEGSLQNKYNRRTELRNVRNVFNDSILSSLKKGSTFEFIKIFLKFSKTMQELRCMNPMLSHDDSRIQFLRDFNDWINEWFVRSGKFGRPSEKVHRELRVTASGTADLMCYLLQSNVCEGLEASSNNVSNEVDECDTWSVTPFNHRSLIGLEFIIKNKKIVINTKGLISLVGSEMESLDFIFNSKDAETSYSKLNEEVSSILELSSKEDLHFKAIRENDLIYVLAAFAAESLMQSLCSGVDNSPCEACSELLMDLEDAPTLIFEDSSSEKEVELAFAQAVSERGMSAPSQLIFASCLIIRKIYINLTSSNKIRSKLENASRGPRALFSRVVEMKMSALEETERILNITCNSEFKHPFLPHFQTLCQRLYEVFSRNSIGRKRKVLSFMTVDPDRTIQIHEQTSASPLDVIAPINCDDSQSKKQKIEEVLVDVSTKTIDVQLKTD